MHTTPSHRSQLIYLSLFLIAEISREKGAFKDEQEKRKWKKILMLEIMPSDESGKDGKE